MDATFSILETAVKFINYFMLVDTQYKYSEESEPPLKCFKVKIWSISLKFYHEVFDFIADFCE